MMLILGFIVGFLAGTAFGLWLPRFVEWLLFTPDKPANQAE